MTPLIPLTRDLVLIGGGHSHALVLRMWGMKPLAGVRLTVINPEPTAPYSGMLPGHIAGHYSRDELDIDLVKLCRFAGARLIVGGADFIDRNSKTIHVPGRPQIGYDVASIDIGIHAKMPELRGFPLYGHPVKPLSNYASRWSNFVSQSERKEVSPDIVVIGGGVAGAEIAMAMSHALNSKGVTPNISLLEALDGLGGVGGRLQAQLQKGLADNGVNVHLNASIAEVSGDAVLLEDGTRIPSNFTCGSAGARPHEWLGQTDLPLENGFVKVNETLACVDDPDVFAAGDCAYLSASPRPKAGVYAVRAAPVLFHNLKARLTGQATKPFRPQRRFLKLISLGRKSAIAEKAGISVQSDMLWRSKNRIDQKFMDQFRHLPSMQQDPLPQHAIGGNADFRDAPLCGGCGAKVGPGVLSEALECLPESRRSDVLSRPGDDAALLGFENKTQAISVDHLRSFDEDPWRMARIATVHALGDIWAMGATPQSVLVSLTLQRMDQSLQQRTLAEIMAGIRSIADTCSAEIVGGHTTLGAETTIGLTVTGTLENDQRAISLKGAQAGDALVLTRPIGSGTLLAAEMAGKAAGQDVVALLEEMQKPQAVAASILKNAHAMTDVTGFGLGGHLLAMCNASLVGAEITLADVPLFDGVLELANQGVRSSIYPENAKVVKSFDGISGPVGPLLFDPQTSGGLLAAVPYQTVEGILRQLRDAGYKAAIIGKITKAKGKIVCT